MFITKKIMWVLPVYSLNFLTLRKISRYLIAFVFFSNLSWSQIKDKPKIEDEFPIDESIEGKGKISEEKIVVEGEDEQLFQAQKEEAQGIIPSQTKREDWQAESQEIIKKEKKGPLEVEKKAQLRAEYGSYHYLGADIYVTKRDELGIYSLEYNRVKYDSEGFGTSTIGNSEYSSDKLSVSSGFTFSESYKMLLKLSYLDFLRGLQENPAYSQQFRRGGVFELSHQFRPSEFQRLNLGLLGEYIGSSIEENAVQRERDNSSFRKAQASVDWQYIFGNRNALQIGGKLWYAENQLYLRAPLQFYRSGDFLIKDVIPLYRSTIGQEKVPWQVDLTLGVQVFFAQNMRPVWGPIIAVDNFLGLWYSRLEFERQGKIPEMKEDFLERHYALPVHYSQNEEKWQAQSKNSLRFWRANVVKFNFGYVHYNRYWDRNFDTSTQMLSAKERLFRYGFFETGWEFSLGEIFFGETGIRGEYQFDKVTHRPPAAYFLKTHFTPSSWDLSVEAVAQGVRYVPDAEVKLRPFFLLNGSIERKVNPTVSFYLRGENLLNQRYILVYPYLTSGLRLFLGMNIYF